MTNTAKHLGTPAARGWKGDARLYALSAPLHAEPQDTLDDRAYDFNYVVVSSIEDAEGNETLIFGTDSEGYPRDMMDLPGSIFGKSGQFEKALEGAGYAVAD